MRQRNKLTFFAGLPVKLPFSFVNAPDTLSPIPGFLR